MSTELATLPIWVSLPVALLLVLGNVMVLTGVLGLVRLPTFYQRIHGPAISVTLGAGCLLIASMIYFTALQSRPVIHELLITLFVFMTAPVVSMLIMRMAVYRDLRAAKRRKSSDPEADEISHYPLVNTERDPD